VVDHTPGQLAETLAPLSGAGADLQVVMAYRVPGEPSRAAIEVYPVTGRKQATAAATSGLVGADIPVLLAQGDNKPGLGATYANALAAAGINLTFMVAQVMGRKFMAVFGFETEADARKATAIIKKAGAPAKRTTKKR
jgi:hypothetical protein